MTHHPIRDLVPPLGDLTRTDSFSVSSLANADTCVLRAVADSTSPVEGTLISGRSATLGRAAHRILEESAKGILRFSDSPRKSVIRRLNELLLEEGILADRPAADSPQLTRALGLSPRAGHRFLVRLTRGAVSVHTACARRCRERGARTPSAPHGKMRLSPGSEVALRDRQLGLKGRIDRLERTDQGSWVITDFKTYSLPAAPTPLPPSVQTQLELYALLVDRATECGRVEARVVGIDGSTRSIEISGEVLDARRHWVDELASIVPLGVTVETESLVSPGATCRGCRLRPRCRPYLVEAENAWRAPSLEERWPLDLWGTVTRVEARWGPTIDIRVTDAAGRLCRIERLRGREFAEWIRPGLRISLFNLGAYLPGTTASQCRHPRNFYDAPPQPHLQPAHDIVAFAGCP